MSDQGPQFACRNINLHLTNISLESKFSTYASSIRWHYGYIVPPYTTYADSVVPERTQQLEASDQGLHSLLAEMSTCCLQSNIWQTIQTQSGRHRQRRLIRVSTVCLQKCHIECYQYKPRVICLIVCDKG